MVIGFVLLLVLVAGLWISQRGEISVAPEQHPIEQTEKLLVSVARNTTRPDEYDGIVSEKCWTWLKEAMRDHQNTYTLNVRGADEVTIDILFAEDTKIKLRYVNNKLIACEKNG